MAPPWNAQRSQREGAARSQTEDAARASNFPATFTQPEIIFDFSSHPRLSRPGERRKVSQGSLPSPPTLTVCQPSCRLPLQPRDKAPTLSCLACMRPIASGTPIPSLWDHPIPRWFHPASSPYGGHKGTFNPGPQPGPQSRASPQRWGC